MSVMNFAKMISYMSLCFKVIVKSLKNPLLVLQGKKLCFSETCVYANRIPCNRIKFFNITQKGRFGTNDFKRGIPPKHFFPTIEDETSFIVIVLNLLLVRRMRIYGSGFRQMH